MKWSILQKIYNITIGSIILLLSALSIFALLNIDLPQLSDTSLSLISLGALLFGFLYIIFKLFIPEEIEDFNLYTYIDRYIKLDFDKYLNIKLEFGILEKKSNEIKNLLYIQQSKLANKDYITKFSIDELLKLKGQAKSIEIFSTIKYNIADYSLKFVRWILTLGFILSLILIYHASAIRLFYLIKKGL